MAVKKPTSARQVLAAYKGAVPLQGMLSWSILITLGALAVGLLLAQVLVTTRQEQLINDTATRVDLQAQARKAVLDEWLNGLTKLADSIAAADMVRLYVAEVSSENAGSTQLGAALQAQKPYMQQALAEFVARNNLEGAHLISARGEVLASQGIVPEALAADAAALQQALIGQGVLRPLRLSTSLNSGGAVVLDMLRPILPVGETEGPALGVLWLSQPVGSKLASLLETTPLDRPGERTAMLQETASGAQLVGRNALANMSEPLADVQTTMNNGRKLSLSVVDGLAVFATVLPLAGSPLAVLQEYKATNALAEMNLLKPGIYTIVALSVGVLAAAMLALTLHLLAQRNRTRVNLLGQSMEAMVRVVEARDPHLAGHHAQVARLAVAVGNSMGLSVAERATLYYAGLLSAVGRLLVPRDILAKNKPLTNTERTELQKHITQAVDILGDMNLDLPVAEVISQMYERENGQGYPKGLKGHHIGRMAKVLGATDAFVALTSARAHRAALSKQAAFKTLDGGAFDVGVLQALMKVAK
jgi:HD-GYP domain-containing protein (c-di-GMP phosphodiesterase class II)